MATKQKIAKLVIRVGAAIAFLCLPTYAFLGIVYTRSPRSPVRSSGNVVPYNVHGTNVYITHFQNDLLNGLFVLGFVAGIVTIALGLPSQLRDRARRK